MKKPETRTYIELLKRRVASLRLMAKELIDCRQSFVSMDLENELGYGYREKRLPDPLQAIEWEILREKSPKLLRHGPAHLVQELSGHAKQIQKHVKSVFQG